MSTDTAPVSAPPPPPSSRRWFYGFVPHKIGAGSTVSLPPLFITEVLGGSVAMVGVATSITAAAAVPAAILWGWLSDRFGSRKLYLALGFLGFGIPTLLMAFSQNVANYLLLTALVGAFSIAGTPVSSTLIMDTTPKDQWHDAFGRFNQVGGWGLVVGRLVGLTWITYVTAATGNLMAQRSLWVVSGVLSILAAGVVWLLTPRLGRVKPRRPARLIILLSLGRAAAATAAGIRLAAGGAARFFRQRPQLQGVPDQVRQRGAALAAEPLVIYYFATFALFTASVLAYTPFAVWQRQALGSSTSNVFLMGLVNSLAAAFAYRWAGTAASRSSSVTVQTVAVGLRVFVFAGFAVLSVVELHLLVTNAVLVVLQVISGISWAGIAVAGSTTVAHLAPKGSEGAAIGTYNAFLSLGSIVGALVSGYLAQGTSFAVVFMTGAAGMGLTVLLLMWVRRTTAMHGLSHP